MRRVLLILSVFVFFWQPTRAQSSTDTTAFGWGFAVATPSLFGVGALLDFVPPFEDINLAIREESLRLNTELGWNQHNYHVADFIQWSPLAASFGLKLCGLPSYSNYKDMLLVSAESYFTMNLVVQGTKFLVDKQRPDFTAHNSFPSGHTATAFCGAEILRQEYWETSPLIGILGYAVATTTGILRITKNRHWTGDVFAGAGVGIASARFGYWLHPKLKKWFAPPKRKAQVDYYYVW